MVDIHLAHWSQVLNFFQIVLWWRRSWTKSSCSCLHKQVLELDVVYLKHYAGLPAVSVSSGTYASLWHSAMTLCIIIKSTVYYIWLGHAKVLLGDAPLHPTFHPIFLCHLCTSLLIVANSRWSPMVMWCSILITFSPFSIFFIISLFFISLLFQLQFLVYRHASHLSRALSFSFRIPC